MSIVYPLAYYAGLIDGDGYIGMMRVGPKENNTLVPTISLGLTHEETVKKFTEDFDLILVKRESPSMKKGLEIGHKQQWYARACSHKAYDVIKQIQPWLLEKAEAALECCKHYEGRVCQMCGGDIPVERPGKASKYCSTQCYKTADRRRRQAIKKGTVWEPIIEERSVTIPERKFSCEDEKLSYLAGICDAEGHLGIHFWNRKDTPIFQLKMCHEPNVKEFAEFFGVKYKLLTAPSHVKDVVEKGYSPIYIIRVDDEKALDIVKKLQPFLFTKLEAANKIIKFYS